MRRIRLCFVFVCLIYLLLPFRVNAVVTIDITGGLGSGMPIAVVPFEWQGKGAPPVDLAKIVTADLTRSGRFDVLPIRDYLSRPSHHSEVQFKDWQLIKAEALIFGRLKPIAGNRIQIEWQLWDVFGEKRIGGYAERIVHEQSQLRKKAHQISDRTIKELIGQGAEFDSSMAYVCVEQIASRGPLYRLLVADSDGFAPQEVVKDSNVIGSPSWSPDRKYIAFVSYSEQKSPKVFVYETATGKVTKVADFKGSAHAPSWSPNSRLIALSLSINMNRDIYLLDPFTKNQKLTRLTRHSAADTSPSWAPNGRSLLFTSDRSGRPQIYRIPVTGGNPVRITFQGRENSRASFDPDAKTIVMVTNQGNGDQIGVFSLSNKQMRILTGGRLDESPTFSPNGSMILYSTKRGGRAFLEIVSTNGRNTYPLKFKQGFSCHSPAWSPLIDVKETN
ncbi:MAG: Tol-Pal system beta propeller repeat protein TolB [Acidiferrobacteraceae bacterium]|nr:Tol-Pal system beta propeller repeat protein TolB [Acidiferrobacteraceae bacterium]|tara:strand:- start:2438 stop:3775 length:1338 start_codon:yes stop_codon:yes gene_type:complete